MAKNDQLPASCGAGPAVYVIRPDGYICLVSDGREAQPIIDYLTAWVNQKAADISKLERD